MLKIIENIHGAKIGYRGIVTEDGTTVCSPSPMGEDMARLFAIAPEMRDAIIELRAAGNNFQGWHPNYVEVIARISKILEFIEAKNPE